MKERYKHVFKRAPRLVVAAALLLPAVACGGRIEQPLESASSSILQVSVPGGVTAGLLAKIRSVPGVSSAATVAIAPIRVETRSGRAAKLTVAEVEPVPFDALAPLLLGTDSVSATLSGGALLLSQPQRDRLGLVAGDELTIRPTHGPTATLQVATLGAPASFADGIVATGASWFGSAKPTLLFVGVANGADGGRVATALAARVGQSVSLGEARPFIGGRIASRLFGSFRYVVHPDGTISQDPAWVRANIYRRNVAILGWVRCHRLMLPQLARALREIEQSHLAKLIDVRDFHTGGGCYVSRTMMWGPSNPPSMHAWGLAIDINVSTNGYGARPRQDPRIVAIFKKWGFRWGGDWSPPDGMHFELASLLGR